MKHNISDNLRSATNQIALVAGAISLHVTMCDCRVPVVISVVKYLAVSVLFGTTFIDHLVKEIFQSQWKIVLYNSDAFPILQIIEKDDSQKESEEEKSVMTSELEYDMNQLTQVAWPANLAKMFQTM